jgi:hypothetical protein
MNAYETGKTRLKAIISETASLSNFNEATARFQLIDRILTEVLCWNRAGIAVEKYDRGDFTDFECGTPAALLVEAKRASIGFTLPVSIGAGFMKLDTLIEKNPEFEAAIDQAIGYCHKRSIPYAAVSNGNQWAFFLGSRTDNISAKSGKCLVFPNLDSMHTRFRELWDLFTPEATAEENPTKALATSSLQPPPNKLSARIVDYPGFKNRNPIATDLQILGGLFFDDIINDPSI